MNVPPAVWPNSRAHQITILSLSPLDRVGTIVVFYLAGADQSLTRNVRAGWSTSSLVIRTIGLFDNGCPQISPLLHHLGNRIHAGELLLG